MWPMILLNQPISSIMPLIVRSYLYLIYVVLLLSTAVLSSQAEEESVDGPSMRTAPECSSCIERKKGMCADECSEVKPMHQRECQLRCIKEYCKHRCSVEAPQYSEFQTQSCEDCLNEQFALCEKQCPTGTPRTVAECKVKCSAANCQAGCK